MLAEIGLITLALALACAVASVVFGVWGGTAQTAAPALAARNALRLAFPLLLVSCGALLVALVTQHYQISYVWSVTNPRTPLIYRITALWGSQQGSLLFWCAMLAGYAAFAVGRPWKAHPRLAPYAAAVMGGTLAFFVGLVLLLENPFARYWITPQNAVIATALTPAGVFAPDATRLADTALGLNPLLRHLGMIIHPPMLYLGFIGFMVPFAYAVAALASGDLGAHWLHITRRWTLVAWVFLSLGLLLGGRWAYDVLGWGGYWGWDPVENAAFLPWLMGTAFLHSALVQERRGMLKLWNMLLILATFSAVIFGTFATRSGLIESVHSFARSGIGLPMFLFWAALTLLSVVLLLVRANQGLLRDDRAFAGWLSREALFVLNNVVFLVLFAAIFWGSFGAPIVADLFLGTPITLGPDYYNRVTAPLFALMFVLMGVAPLVGWGASRIGALGHALALPLALSMLSLGVFWALGMRAPLALAAYAIALLAGWVAVLEVVRAVRARQQARREPWLAALAHTVRRGRRRVGGYVVHLGIAVIGVGVIGSTVFQQDTQQTLAVGERLSLAGYTLAFDRMDSGQIAEDGRVMDIARLTLSRNNRPLAQLSPRRDLFLQSDGTWMPMTIAAAHSTPENDVYALLVGWEEIRPDRATFHLYVNPLINWVWWGGLVLMLGTVLAVWPEAAPAPARARASASSHVADALPGATA